MWKLYGMVGHTTQFVEAVKDTGETKRKEIGKLTEERAYRFLWQKTEDGNARLLRAFCEVPDLVLPASFLPEWMKKKRRADWHRFPGIIRK